jgi:hypothetical protein
MASRRSWFAVLLAPVLGFAAQPSKTPMLTVDECLATERQVLLGAPEVRTSSLDSVRFDTRRYRESKVRSVEDHDRFQQAIRALYESFLAASQSHDTGEDLDLNEILEEQPFIKIKRCQDAADSAWQTDMFGAERMVVEGLGAFDRDRIAVGKLEINKMGPRSVNLSGSSASFTSAADRVLHALGTWWSSEARRSPDAMLAHFRAVKSEVVSLAPWAFPEWPENVSPADIDYAAFVEIVTARGAGAAKPQDQRGLFCAGASKNSFGRERTIWTAGAKLGDWGKMQSDFQILPDGSIAIRRIWGFDEARAAYDKGKIGVAQKWELIMEENRLREFSGEKLNLSDQLSDEYRWLQCQYSKTPDYCFEQMMKKEAVKRIKDSMPRMLYYDNVGPCFQRAPGFRAACENSAERRRTVAHEKCIRKEVGNGLVDPINPAWKFLQEQKKPTPQELLDRCVEIHCSKEVLRPDALLDQSTLIAMDLDEDVHFSARVRELMIGRLNNSPYKLLKVTSTQRNDSPAHRGSAGTDIRTRDIESHSERQALAKFMSEQLGSNFDVIREEPVSFPAGNDQGCCAVTEVRYNEVYRGGQLDHVSFNARPVRDDFASHIHLQVRGGEVRKKLFELYKAGSLTCSAAGLHGCKD